MEKHAFIVLNDNDKGSFAELGQWIFLPSFSILLFVMPIETILRSADQAAKVALDIVLFDNGNVANPELQKVLGNSILL